MSDFETWKQINEDADAANIVAHVKAVLTKFLWINNIPPDIIKREMRNAAKEVIQTMQEIALRLRDGHKSSVDTRLTPDEIKMLMRPDE